MGEQARSRTPGSVTVMTREDLQDRQIESVGVNTPEELALVEAFLNG